MTKANANAAANAQEQQAAQQQILRDLLALGKKNGRLTLKEISDALSHLELSSEDIDKVYETLETMGIEVETNGVLEKVIGDDDDSFEPEEVEEVPEEELVDTSAMAETFAIDDPVRMYLKEIGKVDSIQISVETASRVNEKWKQLGDVRAWLDGDYLCVEFTNTTEKTLFGVICAATVSDANGKILDMMMQSPYDTDDLGIAQGSSIVWRKRLEDAATLKIGTDAVCKAWAYRMEDL